MNRNGPLPLLVLTLATICFAGCARIAGNGITPQVSAVAQQTNGFATNRAIEVQFNTDMNPATINTQTFLLSDPDSQPVPGAVSYDQPTRIASFKAAAELQENTQYTATITTGVADVTGRHLATAYSFSLTTRNSADTSPISVGATKPGNQEVCVSQATNVQISFSEGALGSTVNSNDLFITGPGGNVAAAVTYDVTLIIATITPNASLAPNTVYNVTVQNVQDLAGVAMLRPYTFSFMTGPCGTSLTPYPATYQTIQYPGATSTVLTSINANGDILGNASLSGGGTVNFVRSSSGAYTIIPNYTGAQYTVAEKISDSGAVSGEYFDTNGTYHGFIWTGGAYTATFMYPGSGQTYGRGINQSGEVVGQWTEANFANGSGYVRQPDGSFSALPGPNGALELQDINNSGHVTATGGWLYANGTWTQFEIPGIPAYAVQPRGMNNKDDIAGVTMGNGGITGFVHSGSNNYAVFLPGSRETLALDINDSGVVVGWYVAQSGQTEGFIAAP